MYIRKQVLYVLLVVGCILPTFNGKNGQSLVKKKKKKAGVIKR